MDLFDKKTKGLIVSQDFKKTKFKILYSIFFLILVILSLICFLPSVWVLLSAFKDTREFYSIPPTIFPKTFRLEKFIETWSLLNFGKFYINTIILAVGDLAFCIIINGLAGYSLSRLKPKGTMFICTLIFWSMLLPTSMNMVPLFIGFVDMPLFHINITNTYLPMWLMAGANAFNVLLFRSFFNSIPMAYIEAARIDGSTNMGIFAKIILPLSKPIIMVISIFTINSAWGAFLWPYLVIKDENALPIAVKLFLLKSTGLATDKYMMVMLFTIIPPAIIFLLFSKNIMGGLNIGGIKG